MDEFQYIMYWYDVYFFKLARFSILVSLSQGIHFQCVLEP